MDQIVEDPDEKAKKEAQAARSLFIRESFEKAVKGEVVWYTNKEDAKAVEHIGKASGVLKDNPLYKNSTAIIVLRDPDGFYLRVQGNEWTSQRTSRPVYNKKRKHVIHEGRLQYMKANDSYGFVKGSIEDGESDMQAAQRELKEETGLYLDPSYFTNVEFFTKKKDPRTNPVFTVNVTREQRDAISKELIYRNNKNKGEIFSHSWPPINEFNSENLNDNSKAVYNRIILNIPARGGKTRRSIRSKRRRTHKKYYTK
jgi:8-oxo-dGTP pyrophosphatase MutT (NUDIX family)